MRHFYDFFDREFFDPVWPRSWHEFQRKHRSRWATRMNYEPGEYIGRSLRELICFSMEPEPSQELLEDILARRTVKWTVRHSSPQFFLLSEIMHHVPGYRANYCYVGEIPSEDVGVLISAALSGYTSGHITSSVLLAVLKLHSCANPGEWVDLSVMQRKMLAALTSGVDLMKPIYAWQGENACTYEQGTNCLGLRDTQRFMSFIARAWRENWPLLSLKDPPEQMEQGLAKEPRFRDFQISRELRKAIDKASRFKRPSVYRQWS
jgi:hypothetical protein